MLDFISTSLLISSCREIQLDGNGTIYVISGHVLQGNCVGIDIIDNFEEPTYLTTRQLPMIPIIEWFCRPAFNCENQMVARKVRICTKWYPDRDHIRETIYELKQRFLCSKVPIGIFFSWQVIINDFTHNFYLGNFNVTNFTTKQRLTLSAGIFDFKLKTESI
ncbi:hypothetical protein Ddc_10992 [Ditylenchus destructor]|nr:hypothetical protein Ddc_10992 [Ditylenchus destructor]